ncbi:MAG: CinA family protein [Anaerolineales bacterium]
MEKPIEAQVGELLRRHGLSLALGESCTGGLLAHRLTNVPGSSDYFWGGVVAYSNRVKERVLGVRPETLRDEGAISRKTALEMARGARNALGADIGLAVTGIAGPGGALPGKPVGLTWVALCEPKQEWAREFTWGGDRLLNKSQSAQAALQILLEYLEGLSTRGEEKESRPDSEPGGSGQGP